MELVKCAHVHSQLNMWLDLHNFQFNETILMQSPMMAEKKCLNDREVEMKS